MTRIEEPLRPRYEGDISNFCGYDDVLRWKALAKGIVRIDNAIDSHTASDFLFELQELKERKLPLIRVCISSPGGGAYNSFAIYDALRSLSDSGTKIEVIVEGWAASAAAMIILQAADIRKAQKHARFLLHEARRWVFFSMERTSDMVDEVEEMKAVESQIIDIIAVRCNKSHEDVRKVIERKEVWMSAQQAKDWGLIDEII